jgi:hypothetical protein
MRQLKEEQKPINQIRLELELSFVKPKQAEWVIANLKGVSQRKETVRKCFEMAGLLDCFHLNNFQGEVVTIEPEEIQLEQRNISHSDSDEEDNLTVAAFSSEKKGHTFNILIEL